MLLEHEFVVPVPVAQAWSVLLDVERVAPCMPGASVESFDGETVNGKVKVKVGPIQVTYAGTATFVDKEEGSRRVTIEASGKEARGSGTATATIKAVLHDQGDSTKVTVTTDLAVTGKPAQFGRGVMAEVGNKLLGRFADCLADQISTGSPTAPSAAAESPPVERAADAVGGQFSAAASEAGVATAATASPSPRPAPATPSPPGSEVPSWRSNDDDAIDLLDAAGPAVLKRLAPLAAGLLVLWVLWRRLRRH